MTATVDNFTSTLRLLLSDQQVCHPNDIAVQTTTHKGYEHPATRMPEAGNFEGR